MTIFYPSLQTLRTIHNIYVYCIVFSVFTNLSKIPFPGSNTSGHRTISWTHPHDMSPPLETYVHTSPYSDPTPLKQHKYLNIHNTHEFSNSLSTLDSKYNRFSIPTESSSVTNCTHSQLNPNDSHACTSSKVD
jgi:hypothetical protein